MATPAPVSKVIPTSPTALSKLGNGKLEVEPHGNNADVDEVDDNDDTLLVLSSLTQKERAALSGSSSPRAPSPVEEEPTNSAWTDALLAVRELIATAEAKSKRKASPLAIAAARAREETDALARRLAADESRERLDWSRVLALATAAHTAHPTAGTTKLVALARCRADIEAAKLLLAGDASNQNEDEEDSEGKAETQLEEEDEEDEVDEVDEDEEDDEEEDDDGDNLDVSSDEEVPVLPMPDEAGKADRHRPLSLTVAEPKRKGVQEPRPPRNNDEGRRAARLKFQFPDADLQQLAEDGSSQAMRQLRRGSMLTTAKSPNPRAAARRRVSLAPSSTVVMGAVPLRRGSFSIKRNARPIPMPMIPQATAVAQPAPAPSPARPALGARWAARRKSTSACFVTAKSPARRASSRSPRPAFARLGLSPVRSHTPYSFATASIPEVSELPLSSPKVPAPASATSSQLVLRVRERASDGVPELVMRKLPARAVVWHWHDRRIRVPFAAMGSIALGPHQHGVMLRQLRYVKAAMHDLPWAKTHLRDLLARYTKQDLTKEALYPQLTMLSTQVQREVAAHAEQTKQLVARKQRLTVQLTIATGVVNDVQVTKYGRRGKPHDTRLRYDPSDPLRLRWVRKSGDTSDEWLPVDEIQVLERETAFNREGTVFKRAANSSSSSSLPIKPTCCVSLVTTTGRALDLQVKSAMHREWLVSALTDIIAFAKQFKAVGATSARPVVAQASRRLMSSSMVARRL